MSSTRTCGQSSFDAPLRGGRHVADAEVRAPKMPPPWFVHAFWRAHRAAHRLSGGRFLWTPESKRGWGALRLTTVGRRSGASAT
jgi:hypothetical protein